MSCGPGGRLGAKLGIGGASSSSERLCHMSVCSSELTAELDLFLSSFCWFGGLWLQVLEDFKPTWLLVTLASEDRLCEGGGDFHVEGRGDCEVGAEDACAGAWFFVKSQ